jgi:hypothetical protein
MKTRVVVAAVLVSAAAFSVSAYLLPAFTYEDMFAKSDLVVIARPVSSRDTGERKLDRNVNPPVPVAGVTTECQALHVLKGPKLKKFKFHHYRDASRRAPNVVVMGGPTGISFDIPKNHRYLMFLVRETGGRFAPFAGQTDVEDISVQEVIGTSVD